MDAAVRTYFAAAPQARRSRLETLHALVVDQFPDAIVDMRYRMPTYHLGDGWVALANQKRYISLYTCGAHHIEAFRNKHPKIATGKGCINFKDSDDLPVADIKAVVRHAIEHPKGDAP